MLITPVEASLAAILIAVLSGLVVPIFHGRKYRSCNDCDRRHAQEQTDREKRRSADEESLHTVYRMVRALVVHSGMSPEEKEKVLNDRGIDK